MIAEGGWGPCHWSAKRTCADDNSHERPGNKAAIPPAGPVEDTVEDARQTPEPLTDRAIETHVVVDRYGRVSPF